MLIPAWLAPLLVPYCKLVTVAPAFSCSSVNSLTFLCAFFGQNAAGPWPLSCACRKSKKNCYSSKKGACKIYLSTQLILTSIPRARMHTQTCARFSAPFSCSDSVGNVCDSGTPYSTTIAENFEMRSRSRITCMATILGVENVLSFQLILPGISLSITL